MGIGGEGAALVGGHQFELQPLPGAQLARRQRWRGCSSTRTWPRSISDCRWFRENSGASCDQRLVQALAVPVGADTQLAQLEGVGRLVGGRRRRQRVARGLPIIRRLFLPCRHWRRRCDHVNDRISCWAPVWPRCCWWAGAVGLQQYQQSDSRPQAESARARWNNCMQRPRTTSPPAPTTRPSRRSSVSKAAPPAPCWRSRRNSTWPMPTGAAASARRRWPRSSASSSSTRRARRSTTRCTCAA